MKTILGDYPMVRIRAVRVCCPHCGAKRGERCRKPEEGFSGDRRMEHMSYVHQARAVTGAALARRRRICGS